MLLTERIIASVSIIWAISALIYQWIKARGKGRIDYSVQAGNPIKGIIYNFTWAMLPSHKETISRHPVKFLIGVMMHLGIFIAILKVLLLLMFPDMGPIRPVIMGVILGLAALCGIYLFLRRIFTPALRAMSCPEDFLSVLITLGFISMALADEFDLISSGVFLIYSAFLFFYLPLGKLRHALFFFVARAEYGSRLGYRGTYPAKSGVKE
jgi:nitrate reductase gamma subunit